MAATTLDFNFENLNGQQVLAKYLRCLDELRELAQRNYNVSPADFDNYVQMHYLQDSEEQQLNERNLTLAYIKTELLTQINSRRRKLLRLLCYVLLLLLCLAYKHEAATFMLCHVQALVYPSMRLWRKVTLPLIKAFPQLSELHDEACLLHNPFFEADNLRCENCAAIERVPDLTEYDEETEFVPYIFKSPQALLQLHDFYELYHANEATFKRDAFGIQSSDAAVVNLQDFFAQFNQSLQFEAKLSAAIVLPSTLRRYQPNNVRQSHNLWRCKRMLPARLLRRILKRPTRLPSSGQALERYLAIDTAHAAAYKLPDTECANAYVQQLQGARYIYLRPTAECQDSCRTLTVRLTQSYVLRYNWWYWRPISAPDSRSQTLSISYIGSYC